MRTPFDDVIGAIGAAGYHNHRLEEHSDLVSEGIWRDLRERCRLISGDLEAQVIRRRRKIDLFVGEADSRNKPDVRRVRLCVENKSVMTAHRNTTNRLDDLDKILAAIHRTNAEAIIVATVLVGTATRVLNVPDHVKKRYQQDLPRFEAEIVPRLSRGDETLWKEFDYAVSLNGRDHAARSIARFNSLPRRQPGRTHVMGFDFVMVVPVFIDNVNPPYVCRQNGFGIDIDATYESMLAAICRAYEARWHL